MHTKWCRMDRLMCVMAPALIAAAVWQSGLLRRRGDENAQGQIERTHRRRPKPSGDVYRRQAAIFGRLRSNTGSQSNRVSSRTATRNRSRCRISAAIDS